MSYIYHIYANDDPTDLSKRCGVGERVYHSGMFVKDFIALYKMRSKNLCQACLSTLTDLEIIYLTEL